MIEVFHEFRRKPRDFAFAVVGGLQQHTEMKNMI